MHSRNKGLEVYNTWFIYFLSISNLVVIVTSLDIIISLLVYGTYCPKLYRKDLTKHFPLFQQATQKLKVFNAVPWELILLALISFIHLVLFIKSWIKARQSLNLVHPFVPSPSTRTPPHNIYTVSGRTGTASGIIIPSPLVNSSQDQKPKDPFPFFGLLVMLFLCVFDKWDNEWGRYGFLIIHETLKRFLWFVLPIYWISKSDDALKFAKLKIYQLILKVSQKMNSAVFDYIDYL